MRVWILIMLGRVLDNIKTSAEDNLGYHKVKVKVKLSLCLTKHHAMKTYRGIGGIDPRILDLGTRWR
jgi:hypothetical protein